MAMKVANFNGCKVYSLSTGKALPQWLTEQKKRALSKDDDYRQRVDLIQDFEMKTACQCVKMTKDNEHIIVTGTYPPLVRCYTVSDMAMKFQRGLSCEVVAFESLSDGYGKLAFLLADRTLNFHAPYGTHYSLRVPKFGRDLAYEWASCDLFVAASGDELYRLNLETGQFREPYTLGFEGCNKLHVNPVHQLLACGGESSFCEFWDPRMRKLASKLLIDKTRSIEVSALKFDTDGLTLGVGTSAGQCILFDIRSATPLYTKDHQYGYPVNNIEFHNRSKHVISTDKKIVKIWERGYGSGPTGKILTNIETPADINAMHVVKDSRQGESGLLFLAGEQSRMMTYFVPQLGPAPRWCSFLEGITEELEESATKSVYEDFKFVTSAEVEELGASSLIGTPMLKGYMHGFFMEVSLYSKLRAVSKPFEYEEHRKKRIRDRIEEKRQSRITMLKRLPKVNRALAEKISKSQPIEGNATKAPKLVDERFAALFVREEFQQDTESADYKLRHPTTVREQHHGDSDDELEMGVGMGYQGVKIDTDDNNGYSDESEYEYEAADGTLNGDRDGEGDASSDEEEEDDYEPKYQDESHTRSKGKSRQVGVGSKHRPTVDEAEDGHGTGRGDGEFAKATKRMLGKHSQVRSRPRMFELDDSLSASTAVFAHTAELKKQRRLERAIGEIPLSERVKTVEHSQTKKVENKPRYVKSEDGLAREMTYYPSEKGGGRGDKLDTKFDQERKDFKSSRMSRGRGSARGRRGGRGGGGKRR